MEQHEALERGVRHNPGSMIVFGVLGSQYVFKALSDGMSLSNILYLNPFLSAVVLYICVVYREFIMTCQEAVFHTAWQKIKPECITLDDEGKATYQGEDCNQFNDIAKSQDGYTTANANLPANNPKVKLSWSKTVAFTCR